MFDIQQQIGLKVEALPSESVKAIVWDWINTSDGSLTVLFEKLEEGITELGESLHQSVDLQSLEQRQQQRLYPYDDQARLEDEAAWQDCVAGNGVEHASIAAWLTSIGTENPLPCPK
jgi:hypothetical protein